MTNLISLGLLPVIELIFRSIKKIKTALENCKYENNCYAVQTLNCRTLFIPHDAVEIPSNLIECLDATESVDSPVLFGQMKCQKIICTATGDAYLSSDYSKSIL